jgi:hypothetical protein
MNLLQKIGVKVLLLCVGMIALSAGAQDYSQIVKQLEKATPAEAAEIVRANKLDSSTLESVRNAASNIIYGDTPSKLEIRTMQDALEMQSVLTGNNSASAPLNVADVAALKASPAYTDAGPKHSSNWMKDSLDRIGEWFSNLRFDQPEQQTSPGLGGSMPDFVTPLMWIVLAVVVGLALFFAVKYAMETSLGKKQGGALFTAEEIEKLTVDEWLVKADGMIAQGQYREAIRCLYVANLVRLQEKSLLQLRPHETNWEHYRRFRTQPLAAKWDMTAPTNQFDQFWYGKKEASLEDAMQFKQHYGDLQEVLKQTGGRS